MGNQVKTALLLAGMTMFLVFMGNLLGGRQGMILAFLLAMGINFFSYWYSDKIVLRMYKATPVTADQVPELHSMVREIARRANLPMPRTYIIPQETPNAFATGRNPEHAVVAVTSGLLQLMNRDELEGVIAHEMAHINNRDILIGSIAATMAGAVMILASMARWGAIFGGGRGDDEGGGNIFALIAMSVIAPMAAMIIQMAISRSREYLADETGARFCGNPEGLARALEKLGAYSKRIPMEAQPATAHMFIVNPLSGKSLTNVFSTHPPLEERVARLRGTRYDPPRTGKEKSGRANMQEEARSMWDRLS